MASVTDEAIQAIEDYDLGPVLTDYVNVTQALGLRPVPHLVEQCVVNDELRLAGTCDNVLLATRAINVGDIVIAEGDMIISDKKTTKESSLKYSWLSFGVQLAIYAHAAALYDPASGKRTPMPERLRQDVALICHLNIPEGRCTYYGVDLAPMREALDLSFVVEEHRKFAASRVVPLVVPSGVPSLVALRQQVYDSLAACSVDRETILERWNDEGLDVPNALTVEGAKHALALIARLDELAVTAAEAAGPTTERDTLRALIHLAAMIDPDMTSPRFVATLDELDELDDTEVTDKLTAAWEWVDERSLPIWDADKIREAIEGLPLDLATSVAAAIEFDGLGSVGTLEGAPRSALALFTEVVLKAERQLSERLLTVDIARGSISAENLVMLDSLHPVDFDDFTTATRVNALRAAGIYRAYSVGLINTDGEITAKPAAVLKAFGGARPARDAAKVAASLLHETVPRTGKEIVARGGALFFVSLGHHHYFIT